MPFIPKLRGCWKTLCRLLKISRRGARKISERRRTCTLEQAIQRSEAVLFSSLLMRYHEPPTTVNSNPEYRQNCLSTSKIPLNLPLQRETFYSPFLKKGEGGILKHVSCEFNSI
jgi:hypothetical protein